MGARPPNRNVSLCPRPTCPATHVPRDPRAPRQRYDVTPVLCSAALHPISPHRHTKATRLSPPRQPCGHNEPILGDWADKCQATSDPVSAALDEETRHSTSCCVGSPKLIRWSPCRRSAGSAHRELRTHKTRCREGVRASVLRLHGRAIRYRLVALLGDRFAVGVELGVAEDHVELAG